MTGKVLAFTILGIDKGSETYGKVGDAMDGMAKRGTRAMGLLSAGSVASAGAIAAALGGIPLMLAAIGGAALRENEVVRDAVGDLGESVRTELAADASVMADGFVEATHEIHSAVQDLRPGLRAIFTDVEPQVLALTRGVTGLAREAMPGLVDVAEDADVVFTGLERSLPAMGRGLSGFLFEISEGAPAAAAFVEDLGEMVEGTLPRIGESVTTMSGLWQEHGDQVVRVVTDLVDVTADLGESALPIVSDAAGVTLDVLEGILNVVGPLSDEIGPLIGTWMALSLVMRGFGTVRGVVDGVTTSVDKLRTAADTAGGSRGAGRLATGIGGVMGLLGGPWGIAVTGAVLALAMFGQRSQQAASDQRSLASALRDSGGEFDSVARRAILQSEAYQKIADDVEAAGLTHSQFIQALTDGGPALDALNRQLEEQTLSVDELAQVSDEEFAALDRQANASMKLQDAMGPLRDMIAGAAADFEAEQQAVLGASGAMLDARPGAESLREAIKTLGSDTASTKDQVDALNSAWRDMFGVAITMEEANARFEEGLDQIRAGFEGAQQATANWRGELFLADGSINVTTEHGRSLLNNLIAQGDSYRDVAVTARNTALQQGRSQAEATEAARVAVNERRAQFVRELGALLGNEAAAKALADRYLGMPKDVETFIALRGVQSVEQALANLTKPRTVVISSVLGPMQARAGGGPVVAGEMYRVGEAGEELFVPHADGVIIPHGPSQDIVRQLSSVGAGAGAVAVPGWTASGGGNSYHFHFSGPVGSRRQLEDWFTGVMADLKRQGRL